MELQDIFIGQLVYEKNLFDKDTNVFPILKNCTFPYKIGEGTYSIPYTPVGFIKDLSINCTGETICVVKWNNGETKEIHPSNLISVKAYREQIQNNKE